MKHYELPGVAKLLEVMAALRDPQTGCSWDLAQTFDTIVPHTIEEAYEVAEAIEQKDMAQIKDELGDLLFQTVFYARLGEEQNQFNFDDIAANAADKLIRRHPHVFVAKSSMDPSALEDNWEAIKKQERKERGVEPDHSVLAHITSGLPPLVKALKLQKRCAKVGFDWPSIEPVIDKIREELDEVLYELSQSERDQVAVEAEIGDLLFAVTNLARHLKVDPERALSATNRKFEARFRAVEHGLNEKSMTPQSASLEAMEALWIQAKKLTS